MGGVRSLKRLGQSRNPANLWEEAQGLFDPGGFWRSPLTVFVCVGYSRGLSFFLSSKKSAKKGAVSLMSLSACSIKVGLLLWCFFGLRDYRNSSE